MRFGLRLGFCFALLLGLRFRALFCHGGDFRLFVHVLLGFGCVGLAILALAVRQLLRVGIFRRSSLGFVRLFGLEFVRLFGLGFVRLFGLGFVRLFSLRFVCFFSLGFVLGFVRLEFVRFPGLGFVRLEFVRVCAGVGFRFLGMRLPVLEFLRRSGIVVRGGEVSPPLLYLFFQGWLPLFRRHVVLLLSRFRGCSFLRASPFWPLAVLGPYPLLSLLARASRTFFVAAPRSASRCSGVM